jgi:hypothetical protein
MRRPGSLSVTALLAVSVLIPEDAHAAQDGIPVPPQVQARAADGRVTIRAARVTAPPHIDAVLDEEVYRALTPVTGFIQQEPDEGQPATEQTLVWLTFDDTYLYVGARCRDSQPSRIIANDMRRDGRNVSMNDNFSIIFDTFHDRRNGYEFLMNSIGGAWDTQITDERDVNRDWNVPWIPRSRRDDEGWTLGWRFPFDRCATAAAVRRHGASISGATSAGRTSSRTSARFRASTVPAGS